MSGGRLSRWTGPVRPEGFRFGEAAGPVVRTRRLIVGADGRYTGQVMTRGPEGVRWETDPEIAGKRCPDATVPHLRAEP
jgi:hypothetical protein